LADDLQARDADALADNRLVSDMAARSADALSRLYDRHAALVYGLARRIVGEADAEEVVQDVFAQAWRDASRYSADRATVEGWLTMMTRARAIDRLRSRRARPDVARPVPVADVRPLADTMPDPEHVVVAQGQASLVRNALRALPAEQRDVLELAYFDGLSHSEIAARTSTPLGTVKTRLRAAVQTLRRALGGPS
jgi:RNA polymerase sigma-70 factor (ECF subfamily)